MKDNEAMRQHLKNLNQNFENSALDKEKIKALQNHINQQQAVIHQLQSRLKEYEYDTFREILA